MSIRICLRRLLRTRIFLVTSILVLGLGLGFNLVLFNTAYALLWRPLNFPQPDKLVTLLGRSAAGDLRSAITGQQAWTLRSESAVISHIGLAGRWRSVSIVERNDTIDLAAASVDSGYFDALRLRPITGRFFAADDDLDDNPLQPVILTESAWKARFGSAPSVIGRVLVLQDGGQRRQARVIGIAPEASTLPFVSDAEILFAMPSASPAVRLNYGDALYRCVARLKPGLSRSQASARIDAALRTASPESSNGSWGQFWMEPLRAAVAPINPTTILLLYAAACLLLLLTCANLASLFVARSIAKAQETTVHLALGATRARLTSMHFLESLLVCIAGTALGFLVEIWARPLVPRFVPAVANIGPELLETGPALLAFGIVICVVIALVVSSVSGLRFRIDKLATTLAQGGRVSGYGAGRFRATLAAAQLAIVLTLLTVSGVVGRSFLSAVQSNPGFNAEGIVTMQASLPDSQRTLPAISNLAFEMLQVPGAKNVTFAAESPIGSPAFSTVTAARAGDLKPADPMIAYRLIGPSYFETLGARLSSGRTFSDAEIQQGREVAILNQAAARLLFPGITPLGRIVHSGFGDRRSVVIGVVNDIRTQGLDQPPVAMVYLPYIPGWGLRFIIRTGSAPANLLPRLREQVRPANALLQRFRPLTETLNDTVRDRMLAAVLVGGFALLGLIISSVGLYGTLAAQVQYRRREIGIHIALGATMRNVVTSVLKDGLRIVGIGALIGVAGSMLAVRAIQRQLYGVGPLDVTSFVIALSVLSVAAFIACVIPAVKAGRVDPIQTLNVE